MFTRVPGHKLRGTVPLISVPVPAVPPIPGPENDKYTPLGLMFTLFSLLKMQQMADLRSNSEIVEDKFLIIP